MFAFFFLSVLYFIDQRPCPDRDPKPRARREAILGHALRAVTSDWRAIPHVE